ncbi:MAG: nuclear transport factor 2 family protein [Flavobacterium sp.]|nr:MAG: nuclear transport factor 2 family protein [Flavobacterium sp.]
MNANEQLISEFYEAFKNKDFRKMQSFYADNAVFNDAVFKNLNASQVKAMWEMLITKGKDMRLEFSNISANEKTGTAHWDASYTFSSTGNKVVNKIEGILAGKTY